MKGQSSVELVVIASVMLGLLAAMYLVNENLRQSWEEQRQSIQASEAASKVARAINAVAAGGNGTQFYFRNLVGADVANMSVFDRQSVRAYHVSGGFSSAQISTNNTNITAIPINAGMLITNRNGLVSVEAV